MKRLDLEINKKVQHTIYLSKKNSKYIKNLKEEKDCTISALMESLINFYKENKKNE